MSNFFSNFSARYCSDPQSRKKWLIYGGGATVFIVVLIIIIAVTTSGGGEVPYTGRTILGEVPLIDGHNSISMKIYNNAKNLLEKFDFDKDLSTDGDWKKVGIQTDIVRLKKGLVGGQFFSAHMDCKSQFKDAVKLTLDQIDLIKRLINKYPKDLKLVTSADGITDAFNEKLIGGLIGVVGGHSIESRTSILRLYYDLGVRYLTLTDECSVPWANTYTVTGDNDKDPISTFGKEQIIPEMNRLGMIIDLSHSSQGVMKYVLDKSASPVIFSRSATTNVTNIPKNIPDDILELIKKNQGIILINYQPEYVNKDKTEAKMADVIANIEHIKHLIGSEYIGIGSDFDSASSMSETAEKTKDLEDVSKHADLFDALRNKGYDRTQLRNIASDNFIRVFRAVENKGIELRSDGKTKLSEKLIEKADLDKMKDDTNKIDPFGCRTDSDIIFPK